MKPADEWDDVDIYGDITDEEWIQLIQADAWNSAMLRVEEGLASLRAYKRKSGGTSAIEFLDLISKKIKALKKPLDSSKGSK